MPRSPCACHLLLLLLLLPLSCCFLFLSISIRYPYSVTCIISVSGTRPYIDILERCNGKLRISISWHKLPASPPALPYPHYPLGCHALTLCALSSDLFRFDSISFRFVLVCFAAVLSVFHLRVAAAAAASGKAFPFLCVCLCFSIFHFARVNLQLSPATAAASATSSRVGAKCSFPLCGAMPQRGWHAASAAASILRDAAAKRRGQGSVGGGSSKVARQKFKVQSEHFRFSPLINVSKLAAQLHLPLATCHNSYGYGSWLLTPGC